MTENEKNFGLKVILSYNWRPVTGKKKELNRGAAYISNIVSEDQTSINTMQKGMWPKRNFIWKNSVGLRENIPWTVIFKKRKWSAV
jgi:hypothetical protein